MSRVLEYSVVDVFAERPLEGNPLCVFHDGRGLSDAAMQALARETNLSETTFVLPADDPEEDRRAGVRVRIFTTQEELPFAGHPTLGTASWLRLNHPPVRGAATVTLRLRVGPIPVTFDAPSEAHGPGVYGAGVYGSMRQNDPVFGAEFAPAEIAAVLGAPVDDLLPGFAAQSVSTGNPFCIVAFRSVEALRRLQIPQREAVPWLRERGVRWFYCIAKDEAAGVWRARMQWESGEDPATGSAAGPCIAWLVRAGLVPAGEPTTLLQGVEMLRPSRLIVQATNNDGVIGNVLVAGRTIPVATGRFLLPA